MAVIKIKRGLQTNVQNLVLQVGEMAVATDTGNVYIGTTAGTTHINPSGGTAEQAAKLTTKRNFSIKGDGTAPNVGFDGTANAALTLTLAESGVTAGTYTKLTVDAKGRVTSGAQVAVADINGIGSAASKNTGKSAGNVVVVESNGKIDGSLIPSIAITDVFVVATQAAMLALSTAEAGDLAVRTDVNKSYILKATPPTTLANWVELLTPAGEVISVNGKTGAVTLAAADVGAAATSHNHAASNINSGRLAAARLPTSATANQFLKVATANGDPAYAAITKADVGLGSVDNTADSAKNVLNATVLKTARTIALSGGATGTATSFNGSANITIPVTAVDAAKLTGTVDGGTF